ncbi:hypothetical protein K432DRAFT_211566, partial [Lepidopterella palustris CBS 459.81]
MANQSLFSSLHIAGQLLEVRMDGVDIFLPSSGKRAIGTRGLNGCSCVVIMGSTAIILAQGRGTEVDLTRDLSRESHEHHEEALTAVADLVRQHNGHFPPSTTAWGIFGWSQEEGHLRSVKDQVQTHLKDMGYEMNPAFYEQMDVRAIVPPKGELVGFIRNNVAELWLEKRRLWPMQQQQTTVAQSSSSASPTGQLLSAVPIAVSQASASQLGQHSLQYTAPNTASSSSGTAPAGTRWDGQYYASTQNPAYVWINGEWAPRPSTTSTASTSQYSGTG